MATVAPASDQATDLLQKLSLDSHNKSLEVTEPTKKPSAIKYGSVDGGDITTVQIPTYERSTTPLLQDFMDPNMCYLPNGYQSYYYGGYEGLVNEWEEYPRYVNTDGVEIPPGVYGDNGSLMYHHGYGYAAYGAYPQAGSPVPTMGHDGQLYAPHHYQYPAPYYQPPTPPTAANQISTTQGEVCTSVAADQVPLSVEMGKRNTSGISNGSLKGNNNDPAPTRPTYPDSSVNSNGSYGRGVLPSGIPPSYQDPRFGYNGTRSPVPWLDAPISNGKPRPVTSSSMYSTPSQINNISSGLHPPRPASGMGQTPGFMNRMYPNRMYGNCGNAVRMSPGFGFNGYDSRGNGCGWVAVDNKYKSRGRGNRLFGYGNENLDGLNELNRGPRAGRFKNQKGFVPQVTIAVKGQKLPLDGNPEEPSPVPNRDQYNREEFPVNYSEAKFFVIKSYSEDDIHKSIKYSVWASTPNGNKKLDMAYEEAQQKSGSCPVFLFFSVNTSGQFVGLAEMVGPVDFNKNLEYWQQDKWNGCFPVKWHIVKDVPNSLLKHIILENNDNKPVTNSRDTQEVKFAQGLEVLKIFREHFSKVCILDDFTFYETRQKTLQEKKSKQQIQKQIWDGKPTDGPAEEKGNDRSIAKPKLQKPLEPGQALSERKLPEENGVVGVVSGIGDAPKGSNKPVITEKRVVANGVANGC